MKFETILKYNKWYLCQISRTNHAIICYTTASKRFVIDLVTVFDAILTSRQTREKLQCLSENLMSNNFRKTAVLKNI